MKKVLFTAAVDSHILHFHMPFIKWFQSQGYEVHVASNGSNKIEGVDKKYNVPFEKQPIHFDNWESYKVLKELLRMHQYEIIHCHTPMGAVLTRLAAKDLRKQGIKILYTAHGFHFFEGAPMTNWALYYPVEKWLSRYTDCLITLNTEDYQVAKDKKFLSEKIAYVHGVGVDLKKFGPSTKEKKLALRKQLGINPGDFVMVYAAELSYRKHQDMLIDAMKELIKKVPQAKLLLIGDGEKMFYDQYKEQIQELGLEEHVSLLGYRKDVQNLMGIADVSVSTSRQEGLPVNVMEAMATGLPLVVTDCRGNRDLVKDHYNGFVVDQDDVSSLVKRLEILSQSEVLRKKFGKRGMYIIQFYSLDNIMKEMDEIYEEYIQSEAEEPVVQLQPAETKTEYVAGGAALNSQVKVLR